MYRYFTDLDFRWVIQGGLKMLSIRSNRHESFLLLSIRHAGSRFARRDSVRIESNRKAPQTNQLSLGVLDMPVRDQWEYPRKMERHSFSDETGPTKRNRTLTILFLFRIPYIKEEKFGNQPVFQK